MAWTTPRTWTTGELVTAALLNTHLRDNFNVTMPALVTAAGDIAQATGANALARLGIGTAFQIPAVNAGATALAYRNNGVLQTVSTESGVVATGTTLIPFDDTIPQNTEGDQYMTLAITPLLSTSTLIIDCVLFISHSVADQITAALFQDATVGALAAIAQYQSTAAGPNAIFLRHKMTSGTTSATTFKVRAGGNSAGTTTFNGTATARKFGGVAASTIVIYEVP